MYINETYDFYDELTSYDINELKEKYTKSNLKDILNDTQYLFNYIKLHTSLPNSCLQLTNYFTSEYGDDFYDRIDNFSYELLDLILDITTIIYEDEFKNDNIRIERNNNLYKLCKGKNLEEINNFVKEVVDKYNTLSYKIHSLLLIESDIVFEYINYRIDESILNEIYSTVKNNIKKGITDNKEIYNKRSNKIIKLQKNEKKINIALNNKNKYEKELTDLEHEKLDLTHSIFYDNIYLGLNSDDYSMGEN